MPGNEARPNTVPVMPSFRKKTLVHLHKETAQHNHLRYSVGAGDCLNNNDYMYVFHTLVEVSNMSNCI